MVNPDSPQTLGCGWKIAIILALLVALANSGLSTLKEREDDRFSNHEDRIDKLENAVFGNDLGTAPREDSHAHRLEALESQVNAMQDVSGSDDGDQ